MAIIHGRIETEQRLAKATGINSFEEVNILHKDASSEMEAREKSFSQKLPLRRSQESSKLAELKDEKEGILSRHDANIARIKEDSQGSALKKISGFLGSIRENTCKAFHSISMDLKIRSQSRSVEEIGSHPEKVFSRENSELIRRKERLDDIRSSRQYAGTAGEIKAIEEMKKLGDDYHVFCDVKVALSDSIAYRDERTRSCQIDFVVVGPTGIFAIEVKNWREGFTREFSPHEQIDRAGLLLYTKLRVLNFRYRVRELLVSVNKGLEYDPDFEHVSVCHLSGLVSHILAGKERLSKDEIDDIAREIRA